MKRFDWQVLLGLFLFVISAAFYFIHYAIFRDARHILIYLIGDLAFVPIEVLLVTLIIHRLLSAREKRAILEKMNMVIGAFFSEAGTELLSRLAQFDPNSDKTRESLVITIKWSEKDFFNARKSFEDYDYKINQQRLDLGELKNFLITRREFLLRLLENPNLLEHVAFTDLLWATLHLTEELAFRADLAVIPDSDYVHLVGDIKRAYRLLISEWLNYTKHLKYNYPYLFSLAIRTNPMDKNASPIVK